MWASTYAAIVADFGFDPAADLAAARQLALLLDETHWHDLFVLLRGQTVTIVGDGPSLAGVDPADLGRPLVAADKATRTLRSLGVRPDVVVTDLDGAPEDLAWAAATAILVVHAHGDNAAALRGIDFPRAVGTHQVPSEVPPLRNLEGFTDGDRAVRLCHYAGAAGVRLAGFDLDDPAAGPRKNAKLAWARRILAATPIPQEPISCRAQSP